MPKPKNNKGKKNNPANTPPSTDRLRLLPPEVRLRIYDLISEALTVYVRRRQREPESLLLSLRWDKRYIEFCQTCTREDPLWSSSTENAFHKALRWKPDAVHPARDPGLRRFFLAKASEIIYELTGERRTSEQVHAHLRYLWNVQRDLLRPRKSLANTRMVLDDVLRETKRKVRQIQKDSNAVLGPLSAKSASAESLLQSIQDNASQLPAAVQADQDQDFLSLMDKPNATLNGDVNIFRELSRIVADDANDFDIHLATPVPAFHFSLTSVSRFYRIDALPSLASNISYDFGNELRTLHNFSTLFSPASQYYLKHIKINMVEGFMVYNETLPLISERSLSTYVNTSVANLRILDLDLWPRDPTRTDTESRAWGGQSEVLLQSLHNVNAKVRLDLRWAEDCERFEREYVRNGGWKRIRKEMPENRSGSNDRICHRCYELHGRADSEVGGHRGEQ